MYWNGTLINAATGFDSFLAKASASDIGAGVAALPQIGTGATDIYTTGQLGAAVAEVVAGSPAEAAGMQEGDLVTAVNGNPVTSTESLVALVRAGRVGRDMTVSVVRGGEELEFVVTPVAAAR